jgi:trans-aconitate 2-methyltransferase
LIIRDYGMHIFLKRGRINMNLTKHIWKAEEYHNHSSAQHDAAMQLLQYVQFKGDEKILDIGCGDGKITQAIASYVPFGSVVGVDMSLEMIHFAQQTFPKDLYSNLSFLNQDAQKLNYIAEFDIVFSSFALQWILDKNAFLENASKWLTSLGYLIVTIPLGISSALEQSIHEIITKPEWSIHFQNFSQTWRFINKEEFAQLLSTNYFKSISVDEVSQNVIFHSREHFEKYVLQWFVYLNYVPEYLKDMFFKQIIDRYFEVEPMFENGKVCFNFPRLDIIATKAVF